MPRGSVVNLAQKYRARKSSIEQYEHSRTKRLRERSSLLEVAGGAAAHKRLLM